MYTFKTSDVWSIHLTCDCAMLQFHLSFTATAPCDSILDLFEYLLQTDIRTFDVATLSLIVQRKTEARSIVYKVINIYMYNVIKVSIIATHFTHITLTNRYIHPGKQNKTEPILTVTLNWLAYEVQHIVQNLQFCNLCLCSQIYSQWTNTNTLNSPRINIFIPNL